jgi:hypothetical protein
LSYNDVSVVSNSFEGTQQQAASYNLGSKDWQTVTWNLTGVTALIAIQATLAESPEETDWFTVYNISAVNGLNQVSYANIQGNFVYMRAVVSGFTAGVIQNVKVSY